MSKLSTVVGPASALEPMSEPRLKRRVMIVEDRPEFGQTLASDLTQAGYQTTRILGGLNGIHLVRRLKARLTIYDMDLPIEEGVAIVNSLCRLPSEPNIIVLVSSKDAEKLESFGGRIQAPNRVRFLTKPVDNGEIVKLVHRVFATRTG